MDRALCCLEAKIEIYYFPYYNKCRVNSCTMERANSNQEVS